MPQFVEVGVSKQRSGVSRQPVQVNGGPASAPEPASTRAWVPPSGIALSPPASVIELVEPPSVPLVEPPSVPLLEPPPSPPVPGTPPPSVPVTLPGATQTECADSQTWLDAVQFEHADPLPPHTVSSRPVMQRPSLAQQPAQLMTLHFLSASPAGPHDTVSTARQNTREKARMARPRSTKANRDAIACARGPEPTGQSL